MNREDFLKEFKKAAPKFSWGSRDGLLRGEERGSSSTAPFHYCPATAVELCRTGRVLQTYEYVKCGVPRAVIYAADGEADCDEKLRAQLFKIAGLRP